MAKTKVSIKRILVAACILLGFAQSAYSQPSSPDASDMRSEWSWGGEAATPEAEKVPVKKTVEIPYFDQDIGQRLLNKEFSYIASTDNIRESHARSINVYRTPFGRLKEFGYANTEFYENIYVYLNSDEWEEDLKKLSPGDAAFIRLIVYYCFAEIKGPRFVQTQLEKIEKENQRSFIENFFRVKRQHEVLRSSHWLMFIGFGANFFTHGAEDNLGHGPSYDIGFGYCLKGMFCADFRLNGIIGVDPYKEDIVQSEITYPKEDIHYTAVEALLRTKIIYTFDYEFSIFGGLRLHAIEFDSEEGKKFKETFGKDMKNSYSYSYTMGFEGAKYFGGNGTMPKLFGIGARVGVANFGDNFFDIGGYNWYATLDLIVKLAKFD